jgi:elongation factor 1-beta
MGEVGIKYRIMPEGIEIDLKALKEVIEKTLPKEVKINKIDEVPVAFGLKALEIMVILDDRSGGVDSVEETLSKIDGVQNVDVLDMGLL